MLRSPCPYVQHISVDVDVDVGVDKWNKMVREEVTKKSEKR